MIDKANIINKKINVYDYNGNLIQTYTGAYDLFKEDMVKQGCIHLKDENSKHIRIYNLPVIIEEF